MLFIFIEIFRFVFLRYPIIDFCYALQRNLCRRAAFFRQKCFLLKRIVVHVGLFPFMS